MHHISALILDDEEFTLELLRTMLEDLGLPVVYTFSSASAALTALARSFEMQVVAEGVESKEDWDCAATAGCDLIQGYYVDRPMPAGELIHWMSRWEQTNH